MDEVNLLCSLKTREQCTRATFLTMNNFSPTNLQTKLLSDQSICINDKLHAEPDRGA